jgi:NAD(P)-dependent dehydrogenase (short-subunit alcohol dehydrogenase family)
VRRSSSLPRDTADLKPSLLTCSKRFAHPDEIAGGIYYLASDAASFATGTHMALDGGWSSH